MKDEYVQQIINKLQDQLKEEEENYQSALKNKKELRELKNINQRIKSLEGCVNSINLKIGDSCYLKLEIGKDIFFSN